MSYYGNEEIPIAQAFLPKGSPLIVKISQGLPF